MKRFGRKAIAAVAAASAILALSACAVGQKGGGAGGEDLLAKVKNSGKITVSMNIANEPWATRSSSGDTYEGFVIDLVDGFAKEMGVDVDYKPLEFSSLIPALENGRADMIVGNISRTAERGGTILFTEPIGKSEGVAIVRTGEYSTLDQINSAEVRITTEAGSVHEEAGVATFPDAQMAPVTSTANAIAALDANRADVFLSDATIAATLDPNKYDTLEEPIFVDSFAFGLRLSTDSATFKAAFDNYLQLLKLNGGYNDLHEKYFGVPWDPTFLEEGV